MSKMKKNIALMLMIICMLLSITGCGNQIPEMTEAEGALVTEYAAGLLLKYHADYDGRLVDTSVAPEPVPGVIEPTVTEPVPEETADEVSDKVSENSVSVSESTIPETEVEKPSLTLAQVLGITGLDVDYRSFEVCSTYPPAESTPEELVFSMAAGPGKRLLVLKIFVTNTSSEEITCDTLGMTDLSCKIIINGNKTQNAYISMLENDFMAINRVLAPGETLETAVITEVSESDAAQITNAKLQIKKGSYSATVDVNSR